MTGDRCDECGRVILPGEAEPVGESTYCWDCFDALATQWESLWDRVRGVD